MGRLQVLYESSPEIQWGACLRDVASGEVVDWCGADRALPIASVGKVLLLVTVAAQIDAGTLDPHHRLVRCESDQVADSGLWHHLATDELAVVDAAVLVSAVSDNVATNVLLRRIGLDTVAAQAAQLGLRVTRLHDRVRDRRGPADPPTLATGSAAELSWLMASLANGAVVNPAVSHRVPVSSHPTSTGTWSTSPPATSVRCCRTPRSHARR